MADTAWPFDVSGTLEKHFAEVFFLMGDAWKPEYRAVVEASWHALRNWPVAERMKAMDLT